MGNNRSGTRYSNTSVRDFYLDTWVPIEIPVTPEDASMVLGAKYHERPDILSYDLYGTEKYWWVFMERNKDVLFDPIFDFKAGIEIIVPPISAIGGS